MRLNIDPFWHSLRIDFSTAVEKESFQQWVSGRYPFKISLSPLRGANMDFWVSTAAEDDESWKAKSPAHNPCLSKEDRKSWLSRLAARLAR